MTKRIKPSKKGLINIQNINDNQCLEWCTYMVYMVRYVHTAGHNLRKTRKDDKDFSKMFDFKDKKFPFKIRDIHKIEKKNCIDISVFGYGKKEKHPIYMSKKYFKRHADLLLIGEEGKRIYVLIKGFSPFSYDYTLHRGRK